MKINILSPIGKGGPHEWAKNLTYILNKKGINTKCADSLRSLLTSPIFQSADIIHTAVPLSYRLWRHPVVLTIHGDYTIEKNIWKLLYPLAVVKADIITTPSNFLKEKLHLIDAIVIPNSVFVEKFDAVTHSWKKDVRLVTVTNFSFKDKSEGILKIIEILERIQSLTDHNIYYSIIGSGTYLEYVKEKTKDCSIVLEFMGFVPNPGIVLKNCDIFVYYSVHDNFPTVILEAMASGLPVVTNNVGSVYEIIEHGNEGYVSEYDSDYEIYLLDLINDYKLRAKIGKNARKIAELEFNWKKVIYEYIHIYEDLIS